MAKDLVVRATLDSTGIEQGAKSAEKSLGNIKRYAELAEKGLKSLGNGGGLDAVKKQFSGLGQQIDKFSKKMSGGLGVKQQARAIQAQLTEVATAYRSLSKEEQASASGKWLKNYMNELTVMGGKAQDTMKDMQKQISAMASDTPLLAGVAEATSLVANSFTIAKGAASALGMKEENLAQLQKKLTSLMAISNAAMNIKNALVNQGALKTAILNVRIRANALLTEIQAATTNKATVATKAATAAQLLWNKAIKAHPLITLITVVGAVAGALYGLIGRNKEAANEAKRHAEAEEARRKVLIEVGKATAESAGSQIALYKKLQHEWQGLRSQHEKNEWIKNNQQAFHDLGFAVNGVIQAENLLVKNEKNVLATLIARARAAAWYSHIEKLEAKQIEYEESVRANASTKTYKAGEKVTNVKGLREGVDYTTKQVTTKGKSNYYNVGHWQPDTKKMNEYTLTEAGAARLNQSELAASNKVQQTLIDSSRAATDKQVAHALGEMTKETKIVADNTKVLPTYTPTTTTTTTKGGKGGTTPTPENTLKWFDEQLSEIATKQGLAKTHEEWQKLENQRINTANQKLLLQIELKYGSSATTALGDASPLGNSVSGKPLGVNVPALTGITNALGNINENHYAEGIRQANEDAEKLLKSTEGLRLGAQAAADAFSALGQAIGGDAGKVVDVAGMLASSVAVMIEGYAKATAQAADLGPWAWLAFGLTGVAQLAAMIAQVKSFDTGGIIGGNGSFAAHNDGILMRAHQGEMMITKQQQRHLFDAINGGLDRNSGGNVTFTIHGRELHGVLNNYDNSMRRTR